MIQKCCDKKSYKLPSSFVRFLSTVFTVQTFNAHIFYQQQGSIFLLLFSPNHAVACCYFSNVVSILKSYEFQGFFAKAEIHLEYLLCYRNFLHDGYVFKQHPFRFVILLYVIKIFNTICIYFITPAL